MSPYNTIKHSNSAIIYVNGGALKKQTGILIMTLANLTHLVNMVLRNHSHINKLEFDVRNRRMSHELNVYNCPVDFLCLDIFIIGANDFCCMPLKLRSDLNYNKDALIPHLSSRIEDYIQHYRLQS